MVLRVLWTLLNLQKIEQKLFVKMLLYVVDTGEGKAAITEAKNEIDSENESYAHKIADYDKQIKDLSEGGSSAEENNQKS